MKKCIFSLFTVLPLCAALAVTTLAYPAGIDESLPRVDDGAKLLMEVPAEALDARAREMALEYQMDIVIVTRRGIDGKTPEAFSDDYFDYGGYGWREEETDDITTGSGILLLIEMQERDVWISTKGEGMSVFRDGVWEEIITAIKPELGNGQYRAAFSRFLDEVESRLVAYAEGSGVYADKDAPYNQGHYDENGNYVTDDGNGAADGYDYDSNSYYSGYSGTYFSFNGGVFVVALIIALIVAWAVVASMKRKHNTIRTAAAAQNYQHGFNLTERQDIFLYSNTTRVRIETESSGGGGGGFSGGGSHTSSSGSSHGGGGSKF